MSDPFAVLDGDLFALGSDLPALDFSLLADSFLDGNDLNASTSSHENPLNVNAFDLDSGIGMGMGMGSHTAAAPDSLISGNLPSFQNHSREKGICFHHDDVDGDW